MCTDIVICISGNIGQNIIAPIWSGFCYLKDYENNIEQFKNQFESLGSARAGLQLMVDKAKRIVEFIPIDDDQMEQWQTRVDAINEGARVFFIDEARANDGCLNGLCPNLMSLYSLSKLAKEMTQVVTELQVEYGKFKEVLSQAIQSAASRIAKELESVSQTALPGIAKKLKSVSSTVGLVVDRDGSGELTFVIHPLIGDDGLKKFNPHPYA